MGRKGKGKGGGGGNTNPPKTEDAKLEVSVEEVKPATVVEVKAVPVVEIPLVIAPAKVDEKVIEKVIEKPAETELSNSQKKKNKKNSNQTEITQEPKVPEPVVEIKKVETIAAPVAIAEKVEDSPAGESNSETLKKKRKRNKNKKTNSVVIDEDTPEKDDCPKVEAPKASLIEPETAGESSTLKKRKRNKNKNKNKSGSEEPAVEEEEVEEQVVQKVQEKIEARVEALPAPVEVKKIDAPKPEPRTKGKQKPNSIPDELKIKQEREQQEARISLKNEIERREKLMEKIDQVLDNRKSDAKLAKDQQTLLGNMSKELSKVKIPEMPDFLDTEPDVLFNKIEQVLGVTKLEIKNVQNQQAFVGRLEHELAKVKQNKDKYLRGETASTSTEPEAPVKLPDHIEKMKQELMEIKKDAPKRPKEELIREIESRDQLMEEINKVLDTTKTEIKKVQKQQKIIANLETELYKIKDKEIDDSIKYVADHMDDEAPPEQRAASGTSNLLDALMANVSKLKEAQALKKQKSDEEKSKSGDKSQKEKKSSEAKQKAEVKPVEVIQKAPVESPKEEPKQLASKPESPKMDPKKSPKDQKSKNKPAVATTVETVKPVEVTKPVEVVKESPKPIVQEAPKPIVQEAPKPVVQEAPKPIVQEAPKPVVLEAPIAELKKEQPKKDEPKIELKKEQLKKDEPKIEQPKIQEKVAEPLKQEEKPIETPKLPETKNHDKQKKESPKNAPKNKNNNNKKESPAPVKKIDTPEIVPVVVPAAIEAWGCKLSMADMLKNAPLPTETPIVEIPAKLEIVDEIKIETVAPKPIEIPKPVEIPKKIEEMIPIVKEEASKVIDDMVIVEKADVEAAQAAELSETNESLGNSKNAEGSGFVSAVSKDDVKSLKNDQNATKSKSPVKTLPNSRSAPANKSPASKSPVKTTTPAAAAVPKAKPAPKVNEAKKSPTKPAPAKTVAPAAPTPAKAAPASQSTEDVAKPATTTIVSEKPASKPVETLKNAAKPVTVRPATKSPSPPKKPDLPPKPDHLKNGKPITPPSPTTKPGNECLVVKSKSSPVAVNKPVIPPTQIHTPITAKPKPIVPPRPANVRNNITQPNPQKASPNKPAKSQGTKMASTSTFDFRSQLPLMENKSDVLCAAFRKNMDNNSLESNPLSANFPPSSTNSHMKAILTKDNIKIILTQSTPEVNVSNTFLSKVINPRRIQAPVQEKPDKYSPRIPFDLTKPFKLCNHDEDDDDDDENNEFKSSPRQVFMATICQVCKVNLSRYLTCHGCQMVSYCKEEHLKIDYINHRSLCRAIQLIAKKRGGHIYNLVRNLNSDEYRSIRVHTINLCEQYLNRQLLSYEREILLYPRLCHDLSCQEWNYKELNDCNGCHQVSFCTLHPLTNTSHDQHCTSFALYQKIILRQKSYGRIEVAMPHRVLKEEPELTDDVDLTLKLLYKNLTAFRDDCVYAALLSIATAPLTAFYAFQRSGVAFGERMVIHLVGAELQFEGDTLDKWEAFFLHLAPNVSDLQIAFIGPELNAENLPIQVISRTRMCRTCRQTCRGVRFDFHCKKFYHDYCTSTSFVKPDLICFFNAGLYKRTGFKGFDTWPKTIQSAFDIEVPVLVTSYTEHEIPLDLERVKNQLGSDMIEVLCPPSKNPFSSSRPERNFTSDDVTPLIFKNNYFFVARKSTPITHPI